MALDQGRASRWHAYRREERHAPWKVLLPVSGDCPVLAVGLKGRDLASLGRTWEVVHTYKCSTHDLKWAHAQAECLGHEYRLVPVATLDEAKVGYHAIAVGVDSVIPCDYRKVLRLLEPGGTAVWVGPRRQVPSVSNLVKDGYCCARNYAVLPPGIGRIVVSLSNNRSTRTGLGLYRPAKWSNRLASRLGKVVTDAGLSSLLGFEQVVAARKQGVALNASYLLDFLSHLLNRPVADANLFTGWTKLVLQLLSPEGQFVGIAKLADVPLGRQCIERESAALGRLATVPGLENSVPRVLSNGSWGNHAVQVQTAMGLGSGRFTRNLSHAHLAFLATLSRVDRCEHTLERWPRWAEIWRWAHEGVFASAEEAEALRVAVEDCAEKLGNKKIQFHRVHGDFTPWNAFLGPNGLLVVDWEASVASGLPLSDLIHFAIQKAIRLPDKRISLTQLLSLSPYDLSINDELAALGSVEKLDHETIRLLFINECWFYFRFGGDFGQNLGL